MNGDPESQHTDDASYRGTDRSGEWRGGESCGADVQRDGDEVGDRGHGVAQIYSRREFYGIVAMRRAIVPFSIFGCLSPVIMRVVA